MKARWLLPLVLAAGCNESNVNRTIPPITGIVGGPSAPGGTGVVPVEVKSDAASVVPGTSVVLENLSRTVDHHGEIANGQAFVTITVLGDVGDTLRVTLQHPDQGEISRNFTVPRPTLDDVHDASSLESGIVHAGALTLIEGSGFCTEADCLRLRFDEADVDLAEPAHAGRLLFHVPQEALPGEHTVTTCVAGGNAAGENGDDYSSLPFPVTVQ